MNSLLFLIIIFFILIYRNEQPVNNFIKWGNPIARLRIAPINDVRIPPIQEVMNQVNQHQIQLMQSQMNQNIENNDTINQSNENNILRINLSRRNEQNEIEIEWKIKIEWHGELIILNALWYMMRVGSIK